MAVQQAPAGAAPPSADVVGNAFVHQYYVILHQSPEHAHRFYQDVSKLGRPEESGVMGITSTMKAIDEKIQSLDYGGYSAEIITVDAQDSYNGGVTVLVTGYLTGRDNMKRKFTQSFFLAPQDKGYFVLNDIFRYVEEPSRQQPNHGSANDVEAPQTIEQESTPPQENHIPHQVAADSEEVSQEEVYKPSENGDGSIVEQEAPAPEVIDETPADSHIVAESNAKNEDVPKKSYAYIISKRILGRIAFIISNLIRKTPSRVLSVTQILSLATTACSRSRSLSLSFFPSARSRSLSFEGNVEDRVVSKGDNSIGGDDVGDAIGDFEQFNEHQVDDGVFTPDVAVTSVRGKHKLDRTPNSERIKKSNIFYVNDCCKAIQNMKFRTSQSTTSDSVTSQALPPIDPYSIAAVVAVLNGMPDLDQNLYNKTVNQACLNATWREAFIISLPERRRGLLESL